MLSGSLLGDLSQTRRPHGHFSRLPGEAASLQQPSPFQALR